MNIIIFKDIPLNKIKIIIAYCENLFLQMIVQILYIFISGVIILTGLKYIYFYSNVEINFITVPTIDLFQSYVSGWQGCQLITEGFLLLFIIYQIFAFMYYSIKYTFDINQETGKNE